jgi:hypothetical protein
MQIPPPATPRRVQRRVRSVAPPGQLQTARRGPPLSPLYVGSPRIGGPDGLAAPGGVRGPGGGGASTHGQRHLQGVLLAEGDRACTKEYTAEWPATGTLRERNNGQGAAAGGVAGGGVGFP